jgi:hypothetical protein
MAGGELRLGTTSMYMTTYITRFDANQDKNTNLHGYILGSERKLIAQNQALERVNRGKFRLVKANIRTSISRLIESELLRNAVGQVRRAGGGQVRTIPSR